MWKPFIYDNENYLLKFTELDPCKLYLTDLKTVWLEEISKDDLTERFQNLNKFLFVCDVVKELSAVLRNISNTTVILSKDENNVRLDIKTTLYDCPVQFYWTLKMQELTVLFDELTLPLIHTVQSLELQQRSLCTMLERKDKEIQEYKREKGEISRNYLATSKFDASSLNRNSNQELLVDVFTKEVFFGTFAKKYGDVSSIEESVVKCSEVKKRKLKPYKSKLAG